MAGFALTTSPSVFPEFPSVGVSKKFGICCCRAFPRGENVPGVSKIFGTSSADVRVAGTVLSFATTAACPVLNSGVSKKLGISCLPPSFAFCSLLNAGFKLLPFGVVLRVTGFGGVGLKKLISANGLSMGNLGVSSFARESPLGPPFEAVTESVTATGSFLSSIVFHATDDAYTRTNQAPCRNTH